MKKAQTPRNSTHCITLASTRKVRFHVKGFFFLSGINCTRKQKVTPSLQPHRRPLAPEELRVRAACACCVEKVAQAPAVGSGHAG